MTGVLAMAIAVVLVVGACGSSATTPAPATPAGSAAPASTVAVKTATPSAAATSATPSAAASSVSPSSTGPNGSSQVSAQPAPSISAECLAPTIKTKTAGKLVIGTDNPAYPPWFGGDPAAGSAWQISDPASQKGYESATAYAIAQKLGFTPEQVSWVAVPFNNAIQPGPKTFDFLLNQVSYGAERAQAVDMSDSYFDDDQSVVSVEGNAITSAKSVGDLKAYRLGVQVGTTSLKYINNVIKPAKAARVYNTTDAAIAAMKAKQIDGIVLDLYSAFYMVGAQLDKGVVVGTLPAAGDREHFSVVLTKGSAMTGCVNQAIAAIRANGTLDTVHKIWIESQGNAPALTP